MTRLATTAAVLATVVVICFATLQASGRLLCWQLPRFEGPINRILASRGIAVYGLEGRWQGLNPGFFAASAHFPAGEAFGIDFELDLLESLGRNRLIARRLTVADGHLVFEKTAQGWGLHGAEGPRPDDAFALLTHSDEVWLRGRLVAHDDDHAGTLHVETMLVNQDGRHRFHFTAQEEPNCADCVLTVDGDIDQNGFGAVRAAATRFALGRQLEALLGMPRALAGRDANAVSPGQVEVALRADWRSDPNGESARLALGADFPPPPGGSPARLDAELHAWRGPAGYRGRIERFAIASATASADLGGGGFRVEVDRGGGFVTDLWLPPVDVAAVGSTMAAFLGDRLPSGLWLRTLAPHGEVRDLVLRADADGLAFAGRGVGGGMAGRRGVPKVAGADFAMGGHHGALRLNMSGRDATLAFKQSLPRQPLFDRAAGTLTFAFSPGHRGLRGTGMWGEQGGTRMAGGFAWTRPSDLQEARVTADFIFDRAELPLARAYVPLRLPAQLRRWLLEGVRAGTFIDGRLVYHGHVKDRAKRALRRTEMAARVTGGALDYHPDWPMLSDFDGFIEVTHETTRLRGRGRAFDTRLAAIEVTTPRPASHTRVLLAGAAPAERMLRFVRETPARDAMPFLSDAWSAAGDMAFDVDLAVPLQGQGLGPGDLEMALTLDGVTVDLPDLGLRFENLAGAVAFSSPYALTTPADAPLAGVLFDAPASIGFASPEHAIRIAVDGSADAFDALRLLDSGDFGLIAGRADFAAALTLFPAADRAPELEIHTALQGVEVALPPPLGKAAQTALPANLAMQFLDDHIAVSMRYGNATGWLQVADGDVLAGAVGIDGPMPMVDAARGRVVVGGQLQELDAATVAALMAAPKAQRAGFAWELRKFGVGELVLESGRIHDVVLEGHADHGDIQFRVQGRELAGTVAKTGDAPWRVDLETLRLPTPSDDSAALASDVMDRIVDADVVIGELHVGDANYGRWSFRLRPEAAGVALLDVEVEGMRGLDIVATDAAFWSKSGETRFTGTVRSADVRGALAAWGFAPSVEAERFEATGDLRWPGSPFDFALAHVSGSASLALDTGRFLTVEPGGARIMSLINFSEILRRMRLDFSDVFGRGADFDEVRADLVADNGLAHFARPAEITGSAASFRIGGTVNLDTGALDNEMIVTLSVLHRNLPWYAAFLAFSNPASAAGVLLGSQVLFRNQIKQFSSGKYTIGGTYEDPQVTFVGIWRDDLATPDLPAATTSPPEAVARREEPEDEDGLEEGHGTGFD